MRIGVGLPATIPGTSGRLVIEWARQADAGPFSCLGTLDRVLYDNLDPFASLAAAAAVTHRIRLASSIAIAPLRSAALLAKQASTIQALSDGRMILGLGLGAREDDYEISGIPYRSRGARFTEQVACIRDYWDEGAIGPRTPHRPGLLIGGSGGVAMSRMARYADGYIHNGGPPRAFSRAAHEARAAWEELERPNRLELWGMGYFAFDDPEPAREYLRDYYAFTGPFAERIAAGLLTTPDEIRGFIRGYADEGCDELILFPAIAELTQLDRLRDVIEST